MIKAIIFDFDGTIADSVNIKTEAFAELYKPHGDDIVKKVIKYHLSHGGVSRFDKFKYFHMEFLGIDLSNSEIQGLANKFSNLVVENVIKASYIPGAFEFISENHNNYDMFISTATPKDEIIKILISKGLKNYFTGVEGAPENKTSQVRKIITDNNYLTNEIVFIGDSSSDKEAAEINGIYFIAVVNDEQLKNKKYRVNNIQDLSSIIELIEKQDKFHTQSIEKPVS